MNTTGNTNKPRVHTAAFKLQVCQRIVSGTMSQAQICREHSLAHSVLERWYRAYKEHGEEAFAKPPPKEEHLLRERVRELERLCGQLAVDNELLKRALKRSTSRSSSATP